VATHSLKGQNVTYIFKFNNRRSLTIGYQIIEYKDFFYIYRIISVDSQSTKMMLEQFIESNNSDLGFVSGKQTDISRLNEFIELMIKLIEQKEEIEFPTIERTKRIRYFSRQVFKQGIVKLSLDKFQEWKEKTNKIKIYKRQENNNE